MSLRRPPRLARRGRQRLRRLAFGRSLLQPFLHALLALLRLRLALARLLRPRPRSLFTLGRLAGGSGSTQSRLRRGRPGRSGGLGRAGRSSIAGGLPCKFCCFALTPLAFLQLGLHRLLPRFGAFAALQFIELQQPVAYGFQRGSPPAGKVLQARRDDEAAAALRLGLIEGPRQLGLAGQQLRTFARRIGSGRAGDCQQAQCQASAGQGPGRQAGAFR